MKVKAWWIWLLGMLTAAGAFLLAWTFGLGETLRRREKEKASKELADELKQKVEQTKAQRAEEKAATDAAVAKVEQQAAADKSRDAVDVANDLIADAKAGKS